VDAGYIDACRPFPQFAEANDVQNQICHPFLSESKTYYLGDTGWLDKGPVSILNPLNALHQAMGSEECAINVFSLICNSLFRECKEVNNPETGETRWLPSLLCQSECENYRSKWDECVAAIELDTTSKEAFKSQMLEIVTNFGTTFGMFLGREMPAPEGQDSRNPFQPLSCNIGGGNLASIAVEDYARASLLGAYESVALTSFGRMFSDFPVGLATEKLYPESSVVYRDEADGQPEIGQGAPESGCA
jgi:hypothetical protein